MLTLRTAGCAVLLSLAVAPTAAQAEIRAFQSPSGNIGCIGAAGLGGKPSVRCDIASQDNPVKPRPANCDLDYGTAYAVGKKGKAGRLCHGDTARDPNARTLAYGRSIRFHGIVCTSRASGMRCVNKGGHGFALSRSAQRVF